MFCDFILCRFRDSESGCCDLEHEEDFSLLCPKDYAEYPDEFVDEPDISTGSFGDGHFVL